MMLNRFIRPSIRPSVCLSACQSIQLPPFQPMFNSAYLPVWDLRLCVYTFFSWFLKWNCLELKSLVGFFGLNSIGSWMEKQLNCHIQFNRFWNPSFAFNRNRQWINNKPATKSNIVHKTSLSKYVHPTLN